MRVLGVTGGVGSGKSEVLAILKKDYGAAVIRADDTGREVMEPEGACFAPVISLFGETILAPSGRIDRGRLAQLVFDDDEALKALDDIIHPAVRREIEAQLDAFSSAGKSLAVIESAILTEAGCGYLIDELWCVVAEKNVRISRLMKGRGYSKKRCLAVIADQKTDEEFIKEADIVIDNSKSREALREKIDEIMRLEKL